MIDLPELANTEGAGWLVRTQEDRAKYYEHFLLVSAGIPSIVGGHYYKYLDDSAHSKDLASLGGANKGFSITENKPYPPLWQRATQVNRQIYPLIQFFDQRRTR